MSDNNSSSSSSGGGSSSGAGGSGGGGRPSRILFIRDIPKDLDQHTVEDLFVKQPGFLTIRRLPHFTFVEFTDTDTSTQALQNLQGFTFRSFDKPLLIEYDKDTRDDARKRKSDYDERDSKRRDSSRYASYPRDDYRGRDYRYDSFGGGYPGYPSFNSGLGPGSSYPLPGAASGSLSGPNDCATLYVTSLPKDVTERELSILFRFMPGFTRVRLITREGKSPFCFSDFTDGASAAYALQTLQGFRVDMNEPYGLHIEFDKNHRPFKRV